MRNFLSIFVGFLICIWGSFACGEPFELGEPPLFSESFEPSLLPEVRQEGQQRLISVNPQSHQASKDFYYDYYIGSEGVSTGWTGDHATCNAGTTTQQYKNAMLMEINYFRAMAGVPANINFYADYSAKAQKAALMMSVNGTLDHSPPTSWTCYSADGAEAAGKSNLALGYSSHVIAGYMRDSGTSSLGHRRWILYPQTQVMGTGDIPATGPYRAANVLWVFDSNMWGPRPTTREEFVAWPPPGYVPYQVIYSYWSFAYAHADFTNATVSMKRAGSPISVTKQSLASGYGENTLVWTPLNMSWWGEHLVTYTVTISNVLIDDSPRNFTYYVSVFDPSKPVTSESTEEFLLWTK